jgi:uncharacterized protein (TIGR02757 family)
LAQLAQLKNFLNRVQEEYHRPQFLFSDPLEFVHRFNDPWDQEAVALLSALLAYGNVKQIRKSIENALERMNVAEPSGPAAFVRGLRKPGRRRRLAESFDGWVHRFNRGPDILLLFELLSRSWAEHGSLGAHFVRGLKSSDSDFAGALDALIVEYRAWAGERPDVGAFKYLLTTPADGSCCKRWCMFLRWMGRKDALDPGLWSESGALVATFPAGRFLRADQLVIPLDTHIGRISRDLGLTKRKVMGWSAAVEVTERLRKMDPVDPVRFDFALSRLGILRIKDFQRGVLS